MNEQLENTLRETKADLEVATLVAQQPDEFAETGQNADADSVHQGDDATSLSWFRQWWKDGEAARDAQHDTLPSEPLPTTFDCGICMETHMEDFVSRVASCNHTFCRDCILGHVSAELDIPRYPILCPLCKADRDCLHPAGQ